MTKKVRVRSVLFAAALVLCAQVVLFPALGDEPVHNFEWRGADLRDAFRHVGRVFDVNIVLDSTVKGEVTMTINQVSCEQAIQYLARSNGFNYRKHPGSYIIGKEESLKNNFDVLSTKVFRIYYADARTVADEVSIVVQKVKTDPTTNSLIVTGTPLELENVQEIIRMVDVEAPQISIEARLEEMTEEAKKDLGLQVSVAGGISWDVSAIHLPDINIKLQAMQEEKKSRTIARPNISTLNGREGRILVGDKIPIKISATDKDGNTTTTIQFIEVGVKLHITPRVNRNGDITLYLKPEVSTITSQTAEGIPTISTREVETLLRVKDGQTIIIGGLLRQVDIDTIYKLPLLGDLPVLGKLFQFKSKGVAPRSELVFFITPKITHPGSIETTLPKPDESPVEPPQTGPDTTPVEPVKPPAPEQEAPVIIVIPAEEAGENPPGGTEPPVVTPPSGDPGVTPPAGTEGPKPPETPPVQVSLTETTYTVKKGDTLYSIARKYGVKVDTIYQANNLTKDSKLEVGQGIKIPIPKDHLYVTKPGDTLWRIAKRYGVTVELLCEINFISDPTKLSVGQTLILPCAVTDIKDDRY